MYSEALLEHFRNPRNVGPLAPPAVTAEVSNPACGDIMRIWALFETGRVVQAAYQTRGCTASIAAGSALTEWMAGRSEAELAALTPSAIEEKLGGLSAEMKHAAVLCTDCVKALLKLRGNAFEPPMNAD